jgi:ketosteroid isomerase-like protein
VADMASIARLAAVYSEAICRGAVEEAVQVYAPDGVLSSATTDDAVGHDAIAATIRKAIESFEFVFNTTLPGVIRVDGDRAFARFPVTEIAKRRDGSALHFLSLYDDEGFGAAGRSDQRIAV